MPARQRLDLALVDRNLVATRSKAQSLVMARRVKVNGQYMTKPGSQVTEDDAIEIVELEHPYVGRGGMKLAHGLQHFGVDVAGKTCLDLGASTGGFTDVLLRNGARRVYAVDVGYGQLDASLRNHPSVIVRDKVNARHLTRDDFDEPIEFASVDVSFIPLKLILPPLQEILEPHSSVIALIKPQFEVGRGGIGKGGIVRDDKKRKEAVDQVARTAAELQFVVRDIIESPIKGAEGNVEYLMHATVKSGD